MIDVKRSPPRLDTDRRKFEARARADCFDEAKVAIFGIDHGTTRSIRKRTDRSESLKIYAIAKEIVVCEAVAYEVIEPLSCEGEMCRRYQVSRRDLGWQFGAVAEREPRHGQIGGLKYAKRLFQLEYHHINPVLRGEPARDTHSVLLEQARQRCAENGRLQPNSDLMATPFQPSSEIEQEELRSREAVKKRRGEQDPHMRLGFSTRPGCVSTSER